MKNNNNSPDEKTGSTNKINSINKTSSSSSGEKISIAEFREEMKIPEIGFACNAQIKKYFEKIQLDTYSALKVARQARAKGLDTSMEVETTPTLDLADRAETIIGLPGLARRYREVFAQKKDRKETYFQLFREILEQKWCSIPDVQKRVEIGIKACLLIETEGVVVAPLDGVPKIEINSNPDGSKYIDIYYAGPIRAAGGSAAVMPLILGDYARQLLGIDKYKPTNDEVERYVEEIDIYQNEIFSRQYKIPAEEIRIIVTNCPVCINGMPTEENEVSVYRDLKRIPTNRVRGGVGLVISEGLGLKASWVMKTAKKQGLDWSFLEKIIKVEKTQTKIEIVPNKKILDGLAAGRPILAYPSAWGGFRLRYGRGRNTGIMAKAINPASMVIFDEFIAVGTHGKLERPGKATQFFPCTTIDGPIVLLDDDSVVRVNDTKKANEVKARLKKILYIGDLLSSYGDFRKSAHPLIPAGYCEEWWLEELKEAVKDGTKMKELKKLGLEKTLKECRNVSQEEAIAISRKFGIPLHPKWLHFYRAINEKEIVLLHNKLLGARLEKENEKVKRIVAENDLELKRFLDGIGLPHHFENEKIIIDEFAESVASTFALESGQKSINTEEKVENVLDYLSKISGMKIMDKAGSFIGGRMGRPEQAKPREMKGNPHVLFPIGMKGGSTRSINKAIDEEYNPGGKVTVEISEYKCAKCGKIVHIPYCPDCNVRTKKMKYCPKCKSTVAGEKCYKCGAETVEAGEHEVALRKMFEKAKERLRVSIPETFKGVKGMISETKEVEPLEKGILRARHDVHMFRDGTSRFELLNATITHFKPKEISMSVEKAMELGYEKDIYGNEITSDEQIVEIFPQDIIVHESCGNWLVNMSQFIDELLERFYEIDRFYNAKTKEDLIGQLTLGLAPHTSAAVVGRIIGYTKARLGFGHPYFVCAKRRNVDGDQDSLILLMDALVNFSQKYLSLKSGGRMDAPLVFTTIINPEEVDNEVHEMETCCNYPREFYESAAKICEPSLENLSIEIVKSRLGKPAQYSGFGYTHETDIFDEGPKTSRYIQLKTMDEKIQMQNILQKKIVAVDARDCLERVMASHFLPDIIGNARAFSRQTFRCTYCNEKYRRIPLCGKCYKCGKNTLILTINQGGVRKYLKIAQRMAKQEHLSAYLIQRLDMIEKEIDSVFKDERAQQKSLFEFV
ncbi:MAG: DNA polymerase II large subunit [Candidatus Diapherotrites archaeon]|nr:DNA polymerase II large subunit [Candidatus Diapherotrites archaeon]